MTETLKRYLNVSSNLAYGAAGAFILTLSYEPHALLLSLAWAHIYHMVASGLWHLTKRSWAGKLDELGMYAILITLSAWALFEALGGDPLFYFLGEWALVGASAVLLRQLDSWVMVPVLSGLGLVLLLFAVGFEALICALLLVNAFIVRQHGRDTHHGWLHPLWHVISALAAPLAAYLLVTT